ncbi:uroporphyrinogen-III synthase [Microlunatus soli]|uniref:uroporphyrinogen-III synthase n=1 Tax=Microlunatus soli TaxID=630515 RepID=UPI001E4A3B33|nr:uroporphyrinogen-III synthase [Microlunatus soli]
MTEPMDDSPPGGDAARTRTGATGPTSSMPANKPLAGFTVGVTADRRSDDLIAALTRRGAEVLHAPTLRILTLDEDDQLLSATREVIAAEPDLTLVTTSYGFNGWLEAADAAGLGAAVHEVLDRSTVLVRGPKARGAVRAAGLSEAGSGVEETTASLVDLALQLGVADRTVLIQLHGYVDQDQLDRLTAAGARLLTVAPYRWSDPVDSRPVERLIEAVLTRQIDAVTFTSAPAAEALLRAAESTGQRDELVAALGSDVLPVVVGNVTAAPLRKVGLDPAHPDRFRLGALVRTVCDELADRVLRADSLLGPVELRGRLLLVGYRAVSLSPSGSAIMAALIRADGSVVAKDRLREVLPGGGDDHALEVAIARLRSTLDLPGLVATVVRRGYRLG